MQNHEEFTDKHCIDLPVHLLIRIFALFARSLTVDCKFLFIYLKLKLTLHFSVPNIDSVLKSVVTFGFKYINKNILYY